MEKKKPDNAKSISKSKADMLRTAASKPEGKCDKCSAADKEQAPMSPMLSGLLSRLGLLGLPGMAGGCPHAHVLMIAKKEEPAKAPKADEPSGEKKVLEKAKTEQTTPFIQRCVSAMTGKVEPKQESQKPPKFAKALEAIKNRRKHEF